MLRPSKLRTRIPEDTRKTSRDILFFSVKSWDSQSKNSKNYTLLHCFTTSAKSAYARKSFL
ncbi:MAG: hypothetical protein COT10_10120, partial [Candidatus Aquicultor secundus]